MAIIGLGLVWYAVVWVRSSRAVSELTGGTWLVVYLVGLTLLSAIGSFGGAELIGGAVGLGGRRGVLVRGPTSGAAAAGPRT